MSMDKYPSILSRQMKTIAFIILQIFFVTRAVLKIGEYHSDVPQLRPIARGLKYLMDSKED